MSSHDIAAALTLIHIFHKDAPLSFITLPLFEGKLHYRFS
jgi:hypothetical protein